MLRGRSGWILLVLLCAILLYLGINYHLVARQSGIDEARRADVIVVFGAAEYAGKPSPILKARLDHALSLYKIGIAPLVITTGGHGEDPTFSEGGVGRDYLVRAGVPENNVIAETQSADTSDSAERVSNIMRRNGMKSCVAVSDGYHLYRIKQMMAREGVEAYGSPRPLAKPLTSRQRVVQFLKEVFSVTLWRLHLT